MQAHTDGYAQDVMNPGPPCWRKSPLSEKISASRDGAGPSLRLFPAAIVTSVLVTAGVALFIDANSGTSAAKNVGNICQTAGSSVGAAGRAQEWWRT